MHIGLDFGTTNSGAGVFDGERVHLFPLDPENRPATMVRSSLYITREHEYYVGREAIDTYYRQNSGRARKLVRQYAGTLAQVYSDGLEVVEDVYALVDELQPGRLLRSLKSELAGGYEGTRIFKREYALEELISIFMKEIRLRVEQLSGQPVEGVVLGRPVNFVGGLDDRDNSRAEERLRAAAENAGFREIEFELEPVAAALHFELTSQRPQNIVVFDFGGGTLDITVMRIGGPAERAIFATGGVGIAGDAFDRRIIEQLILEHFGQNSTWGDPQIPFPRQYTEALLNWQSLADLQHPETLHFIRNAQVSSNHPTRIRALESLIVNEEALRLYDLTEQSKIELSDKSFAVLHMVGENIHVWQPLTRSQFEAIIGREIQTIQTCLLDTLERSGLQVDDIDALVRTGGSAQIPGFIRMLEEIFGPEKVLLSDVFGSVTAGLAIRAYGSSEN